MAAPSQGCTRAPHPRRPAETPLYRVVQNHFETFLPRCHDDWEEEFFRQALLNPIHVSPPREGDDRGNYISTRKNLQYFKIQDLQSLSYFYKRNFRHIKRGIIRPVDRAHIFDAVQWF